MVREVLYTDAVVAMFEGLDAAMSGGRSPDDVMCGVPSGCRGSKHKCKQAMVEVADVPLWSSCCCWSSIGKTRTRSHA